MRSALEKDRLRAVYDRVSGRYDFQHGLTTFRTDQRGRRILVRHTVKEGSLVLDAGGGTGSTTLLAADAVGSTGKVVLLDFSSGMMDVARKRIKRARLDDRVELTSGDMMQLPFEDDVFDTVLSTYSVCPLGDPAAAMKELVRVLKPGGLLGIAHSAAQSDTVFGRMGAWIEKLAWRWPGLSLGCRPVDVLPGLLALGSTLVLETRIGILWPFLVLIVSKPSRISGPS